jgi:hypothetical protein
LLSIILQLFFEEKRRCFRNTKGDVYHAPRGKCCEEAVNKTDKVLWQCAFVLYFLALVTAARAHAANMTVDVFDAVSQTFTPLFAYDIASHWCF